MLWGGGGCGIVAMQRSACLFVGPVAFGGYGFLFGCTMVGRALGLGLGDGPGVVL